MGHEDGRRWLRSMGLALAVGLAGCPPPVPELPTGDPDAFELDVPGWALQGSIFGDAWLVSDGFAIADGSGGYGIFLAPFPITGCDADVRFDEDVLHADISALGLYPWTEGGTVTIGTTEGLVSTSGGGFDLGLDVTETKVEGGMLFDFDPETRLDGQISVPICP